MLMGNGQWVEFKVRLPSTHDLPLIKSFNAAQRGSICPPEQPHSPAFLSAPQVGQKPLQSTLQSDRVGTCNKICSFAISSISIVWPSKTETAISSSVNSAV